MVCLRSHHCQDRIPCWRIPMCADRGGTSAKTSAPSLAAVDNRLPGLPPRGRVAMTRCCTHIPPRCIWPWPGSHLCTQRISFCYKPISARRSGACAATPQQLRRPAGPGSAAASADAPGRSAPRSPRGRSIAAFGLRHDLEPQGSASGGGEGGPETTLAAPSNDSQDTTPKKRRNPCSEGVRTLHHT
jgi:hypothetical protein